MIKDLKINQYVLINLLYGQGPSQTWLAEKETKKYVLKMKAVNTANQKMMQRTFKIYQLINHKHIMPIIEKINFKVQSTHFFIVVTQYSPLGNILAEIDEKRKDDTIFKYKIMYEMISAVQHLHSQNIIHRNIKAENVIKTEEAYKLTDFHLAKILKVHGTRMTTGSNLQFYQAPQMFQSDNYGLQIDIWALGILFLEVLLGKRIYDLYDWNAEDPAKQPQKLDKLIESTSFVTNVIKKMLIVKPQLRITANQLMQNLQNDYKTAKQRQQFIRKEEKKKAQTQKTIERFSRAQNQRIQQERIKKEKAEKEKREKMLQQAQKFKLGQDMKAYNSQKDDFAMKKNQNDRNQNQKMQEMYEKSEGGSSNSSKNRRNQRKKQLGYGEHQINDMRGSQNFQYPINSQQWSNGASGAHVPIKMRGNGGRMSMMNPTSGMDAMGGMGGIEMSGMGGLGGFMNAMGGSNRLGMGMNPTIQQQGEHEIIENDGMDSTGFKKEDFQNIKLEEQNPQIQIDKLVASINVLECQQGQFLGLAQKYYQLGNQFYKTELFLKSIDNFYNAITYIKLMQESQTNIQKSYLQVKVYYCLGRSYVRFNSPERAIQSLEMSLGLYQQAKMVDKQLQINIYDELIKAYYSFHDIQRCIAYFEQAKKAIDKKNATQVVLLYKPYATFAEISVALKRHEEALGLYAQSLAIMKSLKFNYMKMTRIHIDYIELLISCQLFNAGFKQILQAFTKFKTDGQHSSQYFDLVQRSLRFFAKYLSMSSKKTEDLLMIKQLLEKKDIFDQQNLSKLVDDLLKKNEPFSYKQKVQNVIIQQNEQQNVEENGQQKFELQNQAQEGALFNQLDNVN